MTTLAFLEFVVLTGAWVPLYTAEGAALNYLIGSLQFDSVKDGKLSCLPTALVNILTGFGDYRIAESICMDPVLIALVLPRVYEVDWFSWDGSDDFLF